MLNFIDKYKFGIIATVAAYMLLFMYLQMESYTQYFPITPFHEGPQLDQEEFVLEPENIEVNPEEFVGDVTNVSRDVNDDRERSYENFSSNKSAKSVEESVKDYEKRLFEEAGGAQERKRIQEEMEEQRKTESKPSKSDNKKIAKQGGDKAADGDVMVEWELAGRSPHQDDNYYVRNPGYTCGRGSGVVAVTIRVNQNGDVTSAVVKSTSGANQCMIEQSLKYAKISRFKYSGSAPSSQEGLIIYRFVSQ